MASFFGSERYVDPVNRAWGRKRPNQACGSDNYQKQAPHSPAPRGPAPRGREQYPEPQYGVPPPQASRVEGPPFQAAQGRSELAPPEARGYSKRSQAPRGSRQSMAENRAVDGEDGYDLYVRPSQQGDHPPSKAAMSRMPDPRAPNASRRRGDSQLADPRANGGSRAGSRMPNESHHSSRRGREADAVPQLSRENAQHYSRRQEELAPLAPSYVRGLPNGGHSRAEKGSRR